MKCTYSIVLICQKIRKPRQKFILQLQRGRPEYTFSLNLIAAYRLISELVVIQFTDRIHLELGDRRSFSFFTANHKK